MSVVIAVVLVLTAAGGTAVVVTREPVCQAIVLSVFGLVLAILFVVLQAPDVGLSQLVIGAAVLPLMVLLAIAKVHGRERR
jgi:energy-converting hydrogenase B subunit D